MMPFPRPHIAAILLAAGQSSRFGGNKLSAQFIGKTVAEHSAEALAALGLGHLFAVCQMPIAAITALGFTPLQITPPDAPMSRSLAIGVEAAQAKGARAVLIMLADMPLVPRSHFERLLDAFNGDRIASLNGKTPMPPALFGEAHFAALRTLTGDRGAGSFLRGAPAIALPDNAAIDIDTPDDLAIAARLFPPDQPLR